MKTQILKPNQLSMVQGEPRVFDLHLAASLGFDNLHEIRRLVARNENELRAYGEVSVTVTKTSTQGGRPGKAYYLNEGQALVICALSRTPKAAEVRKLVIDVFMAWRRGKTVHVTEHYRKPPEPTAPPAHFDLVERPDGLCFVSMIAPKAFAFDVARQYCALLG